MTIAPMKSLFSPLTEKELDRLDRFLLERIDTDADAEGMDEGVLAISELDGLLTALVSGPDLIPPSKWLVAVWGDFEPIWNSEQEFQQIFSLMMRHMNGIAATLMEQPEDFEPIFMERVVEDKTYIVVDECCEGYMRGIALAGDRWNSGGTQMAKLLHRSLWLHDMTSTHKNQDWLRCSHLTRFELISPVA
jgi:uncharacterized protein